MRGILTIIHLITPYLVIPILLAGFIKWKHLPAPFRIFIVGAFLSALISIVKSRFNDSNIGFYLSALFGVTLYGILFHILLRKAINENIIWMCVAFIWAIISWYSFQNGVKGFQLRIIIPFDIFMITFSGIYVIHYLRSSENLNTSVFFLVLFLLMEFCVNLFLDMISNFLKSYFSDNFMTLLWKEILPVYILLRVAALVLLILSVKPKLPSLDKMPGFGN
ncbi:hypothetical protein [Larkinella punicea]|uniref:Uncharacterized protein n=1 Tax=Larkinella punicea TaxID=2315727 RepID=A0A368JHS1_9BACT|nr:hypothetical protein [Larkinella punicea]RCR67219.1 hypothetical protein DUE52_23180 [Larkinella punicea]